MKMKQIMVVLILVFLPLLSVQAGVTSFCKKFQEADVCGGDEKTLDLLKGIGVETAVIGKADGSLQCEPDSGLSLGQMVEEQLKDINVFSSFKRHDGLGRTRECGSETGMMNAYEISVEDIEKALEKDFVLLFVVSSPTSLWSS